MPASRRYSYLPLKTFCAIMAKHWLAERSGPNGSVIGPGGLARVTKLYHDESAPDILFQVEGLEEQAKYPDGDKTIGVFRL
jgi:hypothetical protein